MWFVYHAVNSTKLRYDSVVIHLAAPPTEVMLAGDASALQDGVVTTYSRSNGNSPPTSTANGRSSALALRPTSAMSTASSPSADTPGTAYYISDLAQAVHHRLAGSVLPTNTSAGQLVLKLPLNASPGLDGITNMTWLHLKPDEVIDEVLPYTASLNPNESDIATPVHVTVVGHVGPSGEAQSARSPSPRGANHHRGTSPNRPVSAGPNRPASALCLTPRKPESPETQLHNTLLRLNTVVGESREMLKGVEDHRNESVKIDDDQFANDDEGEDDGITRSDRAAVHLRESIEKQLRALNQSLDLLKEIESNRSALEAEADEEGIAARKHKAQQEKERLKRCGQQGAAEDINTDEEPKMPMWDLELVLLAPPVQTAEGVQSPLREKSTAPGWPKFLSIPRLTTINGSMSRVTEYIMSFVASFLRRESIAISGGRAPATFDYQLCRLSYLDHDFEDFVLCTQRTVSMAANSPTLHIELQREVQEEKGGEAPKEDPMDTMVLTHVPRHEYNALRDQLEATEADLKRLKQRYDDSCVARDDLAERLTRQQEKAAELAKEVGELERKLDRSEHSPNQKPAGTTEQPVVETQTAIAQQTSLVATPSTAVAQIGKPQPSGTFKPSSSIALATSPQPGFDAPLFALQIMARVSRKIVRCVNEECTFSLDLPLDADARLELDKCPICQTMTQCAVEQRWTALAQEQKPTQQSPPRGTDDDDEDFPKPPPKAGKGIPPPSQSALKAQGSINLERNDAPAKRKSVSYNDGAGELQSQGSAVPSGTVEGAPAGSAAADAANAEPEGIPIAEEDVTAADQEQINALIENSVGRPLSEFSAELAEKMIEQAASRSNSRPGSARQSGTQEPAL